MSAEKVAPICVPSRAMVRRCNSPYAKPCGIPFKCHTNLTYAHDSTEADDQNWAASSPGLFGSYSHLKLRHEPVSVMKRRVLGLSAPWH